MIHDFPRREHARGHPRKNYHGNWRRRAVDCALCHPEDLPDETLRVKFLVLFRELVKHFWSGFDQFLEFLPAPWTVFKSDITRYIDAYRGCDKLVLIVKRDSTRLEQKKNSHGRFRHDSGHSTLASILDGVLKPGTTECCV